MSKRNPLLRDIRDAKLISKLNATGLTLMMRKNAEALHLDLAGQSRAFNPARPPKRRRNPRSRIDLSLITDNHRHRRPREFIALRSRLQTVEGAMTDTSFECNHERIKAVDDAFDAAWAFIQASEPERDLKYDCERMTALSQRIAELSAEGITNPSELRRLALGAWPLWLEPTT